MFPHFLLLLFCLINYSGTPLAGSKAIPVTANKASNVTLPCDFEAREISHYHFSSWSKVIYVCQNEECESENGRVFKKGSCDVVIKDLRFSDAGKYFLRVYYKNAQAMLERLTLEYQLHIHDEISVKIGEELKLDVLLSNANKVVHQSKISTEWTELWTRGHGVSSDRLTDRDGNLTINEFTVNDTGTYRVLDSEGETLITVTVSESRTDSKGNMDTDDDKTDGIEQPTVMHCILTAEMILYGILLVVGLIIVAVKKHQFLNKKVEHDSSQCNKV
ncbi:hypothetical protein R3I94_018522 [Phoxinus phoxinus]